MFIVKFNKSVIVTYLGVIFGCLSMYFAFSKVAFAEVNHIRYSLIFLMLAGVCDMFDGKIARNNYDVIDEWEIIDTGFDTYNWKNIVYNPDDMKLNIYSDTGYMSSSTDEGSNWTTPIQINPFSSLFNGKVAYGNGVYVAVATSSNKLYKSTSSDGETWTTATQINLIPTVYEGNYAFGFDGNYFILVNSDGTILKTLDGDSWTIDETVSNLANTSWGSIAFDKYDTATKAILLNRGYAEWLNFSVKQAVEATIISCTQ
jgi:hypothetical protein